MIDNSSTPCRPRSISAVLPAFNEEGSIGAVVRKAHGVLSALGLDRFEIIVVDDGSTDATADVVNGLRLDGVRVCRHDRNRGYGGALRTGFDKASCDTVWLSDSDGQFDPEDLRLLVAAYEERTVVAGHRQERADNLVRRLNSWAFFSLVRILFGRTVADVDCGFKLFPREVGVGLESDGALISTELLWRAKRAGYRFREVPVRHYSRTTGAATGARLSVVLRAFDELLRLRLHPPAGAPSSGSPTGSESRWRAA